jgi:hypothetical protein
MGRHTALQRILLAIFFAMLFQGSHMRVLALSSCDFSQEKCAAQSHDTNQDRACSFESTIARQALSPTSQSSEGISPVVRTLPRALRSLSRVEVCSAALRSIDSTTAAHRYGLYNHKILFYSHPRHYYLNGLMRLII